MWAELWRSGKRRHHALRRSRADFGVEGIGPTALVLGLALVVLVASGRQSFAALGAAGDISSTQLNPTTFHYDLTLHDTGTTNIGTFWYSWVPGFGFLDSQPFNVQSPSGWTDNLTDGNRAIKWSTVSSALSPGGSLTGFQFDSHDTPSQVFGFSNAFPSTLVDTSFTYIGAPFGDAGLQFVVTPVPEPSSLVLAGAGAVVALGAFYLRRRAANQQRLCAEWLRPADRTV